MIKAVSIQRMQRALLCTALLLLMPAESMAHLVTTGMGPVYDGIGHLLLTPEDLIPAFILAMYCGLRGIQSSRIVLFVLPASWFLAGLGGIGGAYSSGFPLQVCSFLVIGLLVAADLRLPTAAIILLAAVVGSVHGFLNGVALGESQAVLGLVGIMAALFVLISLVAALVISIRIQWLRIAVRVLGSWTVASGVLMIGWYLKGIRLP